MIDKASSPSPDKTTDFESILNTTFDIRIYFEIFSIKYSDKCLGNNIITSSSFSINCILDITLPWCVQ